MLEIWKSKVCEFYASPVVFVVAELNQERNRARAQKQLRTRIIVTRVDTTSTCVPDVFTGGLDLGRGPQKLKLAASTSGDPTD
jgi:hypothetical protein